MVRGLFCRFWKCENSTRFKCSTKFENARSGTSNKIKLWSFRWETASKGLNIIYLDLNHFCPCLLDPTQGYEVRWAIAGKSIVTQLVAKLDDGKFRFGKKESKLYSWKIRISILKLKFRFRFYSWFKIAWLPS